MKTFLIIALIISSTISLAQNSAFGKENLKGKIKKITTVYFEEDLENGTGFYKVLEEVSWFKVGGLDSLMISKSVRDDFSPRQTTYIYDEEGRLETKSEFDIYDKITRVYSYKYDLMNRIIKEHRFSYNYMEYEDEYYEYNQEGEVIKVELITSGGTTTVTNYEYKKGNTLKVLSIYSEPIIYKYNEYGDCIYDESSSRTALSEYEYDEFGNWIKWYEWIPKYADKNSHPSGLRTIEYYKNN